LLYVPGDRDEMLARAPERGADALILNLEDAVAPARKEIARASVVLALNTLAFGRTEVIVRPNPVDSDAGFRDLLAVVPARPDALLLPKVRSAEEVRFAAWTLDRLETLHGSPDARIGLLCMIESAAGVLAAAEIARAHPRVRALVFGAADYAEDVGCVATEDRRTFLPALAQLVLAAHAAGIAAIDAPHMRPGDAQGLRAHALQARELGFDGKSAIHPAQLPVIHEVFSPAAEEIAWAKEVLAVLGAGADDSLQWGAALLGGELVEAPHVMRARRILAMAEQIGTKPAAEA
jgi:citrate lyase subunit beta/citryl-CoA lyase